MAGKCMDGSSTSVNFENLIPMYPTTYHLSRNLHLQPGTLSSLNPEHSSCPPPNLYINDAGEVCVEALDEVPRRHGPDVQLFSDPYGETLQ